MLSSGLELGYIRNFLLLEDRKNIFYLNSKFHKNCINQIFFININYTFDVKTVNCQNSNRNIY